MNSDPHSNSLPEEADTEQGRYEQALAIAKASIAGRTLRRPKATQKERDEFGNIYTRDLSGRPCWDTVQPQRVLLLHDLRMHDARLHAGLLGMTLPEATDGYRFVGVEFDNGARAVCSAVAVQEVAVEYASKRAADLIAANRGTRFDADPTVADIEHQRWLIDTFSKTLDFLETEWTGTGLEEVYAYSYESLRELARIRHEDCFPIKIGWSGNGITPSLTRISQQVFGPGIPERPLVLAVHRTRNGRALEKFLHQHLKAHGAHKKDAIGSEWFMTSVDAFRQIVGNAPEQPNPIRPLKGEVANDADYYNEFRIAETNSVHSEMSVRILHVKKIGEFEWLSVPFDDLFEVPRLT